MQNLLNQLDSIFDSIGFSDRLREPITESEVGERAEELPMQLPDSVVNLYKWHDGLYSWYEGSYEGFFPGYDLLSLQEAIAQRKMLLDFSEELQDDEFYNSAYLPIFEFQDSYFVVDCESSFSVYSIWIEGGDRPIKQYDNLEQMLQVIVDSYLCGAFYVEDEFLHENTVLFQKVRKKYISVELRQKEEDKWSAIAEQSESFDSLADKEFFISRLYETFDERAIPYLQKYLSSPNTNIVSSAAFGLGELKARESLPDLLKLLEHPEEQVRNLSTAAISEIISPADSLLLQPLLSKLEDSSSLVRIHAIEALGQLRSEKAMPVLIRDIKQQNPNTRLHVIEALKKIGNSECLNVIRSLIDEGLEGLELQIAERAIGCLERKLSRGNQPLPS